MKKKGFLFKDSKVNFIITIVFIFMALLIGIITEFFIKC